MEGETGQRPRLARAAVMVCVIGEAGGERLSRCLATISAHTSADVPLLLAGKPPDEAKLAVSLLQLPSADPASLNTALELAAPADVVMVHDSVRVGTGWLDGLRAAARSDSTVAAAAPLVTDGGFLGIHSPVSEDALEGLVAAVAHAAPKARPRVPPGARCLYLRREAIELVGPLDASLGALPSALADFVSRCIAHGLQQVAADDVIVLDDEPWDARGGDELLAARYPWIVKAVELADVRVSGPLARSRASAQRSARGLTVTFDARVLRNFLSGAQIHVLELVHAVARTGRARLRLVVSPELGGEPAALLGEVEAERLSYDELRDGMHRTDIVHRPHQVFSLDDINVLRRLGERVVISQQDLIAYRNPAYHRIPELWEQYRRATRLSLATADAVLFLSRHALDDALADDLLNPARGSVLPIGIEHRVAQLSSGPRRPRRLGAREPEGFLLCLGTNFLHKNLLFGMRVFEALRDAHSWRGGLVIAGPSLDHGSSAAEERTWLAARPQLAAAVERLGPVDESEKAWLIANAAAVLYPSTYEGFGLVPFEAARAGTPCLWAPQASLREVLPESEAMLVPWDADASAERALRLLRDEPARARHIEAVLRAADALPDWDAHAEALLDVYERVVSTPFREAAAVAWEALEREREVAGWNDLKAELGMEGFGLVGPGGYLPADVQTALLSIVTRPRLRDPFFAALRGMYRAGRRVRREGG